MSNKKNLIRKTTSSSLTICVCERANSTIISSHKYMRGGGFLARWTFRPVNLSLTLSSFHTSCRNTTMAHKAKTLQGKI